MLWLPKHVSTDQVCAVGHAGTQLCICIPEKKDRRERERTLLCFNSNSWVSRTLAEEAGDQGFSAPSLRVSMNLQLFPTQCSSHHATGQASSRALFYVFLEAGPWGSSKRGMCGANRKSTNLRLYRSVRWLLLWKTLGTSIHMLGGTGDVHFN